MSEHGFEATSDRVVGIGRSWENRAAASQWDDDEVVDQALRLVADHHAALGAMIACPTPEPTRDELRRSPLGQDLRLLARAAEGAASPEETRVAAARVEEALLRPLAADDYAVPHWFGGTALGRLLARAQRVSLGPDGLLTPAAAAARLGVGEAEIAPWLVDGSLPSLADGDGQALVPRTAIERRRLVALAFADDAPLSAQAGPTDDFVRVELPRAS